VHNWGFIFLSSAVTIVVAYGFYELVEVRLSNLMRKGIDAMPAMGRRPRRKPRVRAI
jgi:peptidoglycan/LPS O-acetylase OafA/YrhL